MFNTFYKQCNKAKFLFFSFELSDGSQDDIYQFRNLIIYRDRIKNFIVENFIFNDIHYKLYGIICMESSKHYTAYCHNCLTNKLHLNINQSYYYDDLLNSGLILMINENNFNNKINKIMDKNPFIILYIQDN